MIPLISVTWTVFFRSKKMFQKNIFEKIQLIQKNNAYQKVLSEGTV